MTIKNKIFIALFFIVSVCLVGYLYTQHYKAQVVIGGEVFKVDVSDNSYTLAKGLSGRLSMQNDEGMLFIFKTAGNEGFWMKDMNFSLDIIWMDENFDIVHIEKSLTPETYPKIFYPNAQALYVLEVNAGLTDKLGVKVGDRVRFLK